MTYNDSSKGVIYHPSKNNKMKDIVFINTRIFSDIIPNVHAKYILVVLTAEKVTEMSWKKFTEYSMKSEEKEAKKGLKFLCDNGYATFENETIKLTEYAIHRYS